MAKIGLIDLDGKNFPNIPLMKISAFHKQKGDSVDWVTIGDYDKTYISKIFTFSPEFVQGFGNYGEIVKGGTGYDIASKLPTEIDMITNIDYSIYPQIDYSVQFFSRGCIRNCPFCVVRKKEGNIRAVEPMDLNPKGGRIEVLDNNFFANPEWKSAVDLLLKWNKKINLHGVDVRIMNEEQAFWLNKLKIDGSIHIAWDFATDNILENIKEMLKYVKAYKIICYVLIGFNTDIEQDLYRVRKLKELGIRPFVQPYRDFNNERIISQYEKDFAGWVNKRERFMSFDFVDFQPRKGFKCSFYLNAFEKSKVRGQKIFNYGQVPTNVH